MRKKIQNDLQNVFSPFYVHTSCKKLVKRLMTENMKNRVLFFVKTAGNLKKVLLKF